MELQTSRYILYREYKTPASNEICEFIAKDKSIKIDVPDIDLIQFTEKYGYNTMLEAEDYMLTIRNRDIRLSNKGYKDFECRVCRIFLTGEDKCKAEH